MGTGYSKIINWYKTYHLIQSSSSPSASTEMTRVKQGVDGQVDHGIAQGTQRHTATQGNYSMHAHTTLTRARTHTHTQHMQTVYAHIRLCTYHPNKHMCNVKVQTTGNKHTKLPFHTQATQPLQQARTPNCGISGYVAKTRPTKMHTQHDHAVTTCGHVS